MNRMLALFTPLLLAVALFSSCSAAATADVIDMPSLSRERNGKTGDLPRVETVAAFTADAENIPVPLASAPSKKNDADLDSAVIESELLELINALRVENKVDKLQADDIILSAARLRSSELQESFSHTRPDGSSYYTAFEDVGFKYSGKWHGENASSVSFTSSVYTEKQLAKLMFGKLSESPGHTRNMLREKYGLVGIGCSVRVEDNTVYVTSSQLFASK